MVDSVRGAKAPVEPVRSRRRAIVATLAVAHAIVLVALAATLFNSTSGSHAQDLHLYARAGRNVLAGLVPYRDFSFEYPPFALVPMVIPAAFESATPDARSFLWPFLLTNAVWSTLLGLAVFHLAFTLAGWRHAVRSFATYAAFSALGAPIFPWRFDFFPALLSAVALIAVLEGWPAAAGLLLGLGVVTKVYPIVLVPIVGAWYLTARDGAALRRFLLSVIGAIVAVMLPLVLAAPHDVFSFVAYHAGRGLQLESTAASVLLAANKAGLLGLAVEENYGAMHVVFAGTAAIKAWLLAAFGAAMTAVAFVAWRRFGALRGDGEALWGMAGAAVLAFILTNRAFSPQYLAWLLPFLPLLRAGQGVLAGAALALTIFIFPYHYRSLIGLDGVAVGALCLRNLLLVVLAVWMVRTPGSRSVRAVPIP